MSIVKVLPDLCAPGGPHMALDDGLLQTAESVFARRYTWSPPALSLGKFQSMGPLPPLPFDVIRRPTGGRAVLHGAEFEWSFAVVFPPGLLGGSPALASVDVASPYDIVSGAFAAALEELGVTLSGTEDTRARRSQFCFASVMRHDLLARDEKIVAIAQARAGGRVLVHGSVLEQRPPQELTEAAAALLGEPWVGEGLAGAGYALVRDTLWKSVLLRLEHTLRAARDT